MQIFYTPEALADLENVKASVIDKFCDVKMAEDVVKAITKSIRNLEMFPYMGQKIELSYTALSGHRYLFSNHNYIFYRIDGETVRILRVLNEKQDYMRILFGITE